MERYNKIIEHVIFKQAMNKIELYEKNREFCKHDFQHVISVCRIAYIISLENKNDISKDIIYAMGLLHDIGRCQSYQTEVEHDVAGAELAITIMNDVGYSKYEIDMIMDVILNHRNSSVKNNLCKILYKADKLSRQCFKCCVQRDCYWDEIRKNKILIY